MDEIEAKGGDSFRSCIPWFGNSTIVREDGVGSTPRWGLRCSELRCSGNGWFGISGDWGWEGGVTGFGMWLWPFKWGEWPLLKELPRAALGIRVGFTSEGLDDVDVRGGSVDLLAVFVFPLGRAWPLERPEAYGEEYVRFRSNLSLEDGSEPLTRGAVVFSMLRSEICCWGWGVCSFGAADFWKGIEEEATLSRFSFRAVSGWRLGLCSTSLAEDKEMPDILRAKVLLSLSRPVRIHECEILKARIKLFCLNHTFSQSRHNFLIPGGTWQPCGLS